MEHDAEPVPVGVRVLGAGRGLVPTGHEQDLRRAACTFDSGWSAGTKRSSPHHTWTGRPVAPARAAAMSRRRAVDRAVPPSRRSSTSARRLAPRSRPGGPRRSRPRPPRPRHRGRAGRAARAGRGRRASVAASASAERVGQCSGPMSCGRHADRVDGDRVAPAGLERLAQQVDVAPARGLERAVDRLDAVEPGVDVDVVGLGGDVGAELGARGARPGSRPAASCRAGIVEAIGRITTATSPAPNRASRPASPRWSGALLAGPRARRRRLALELDRRQRDRRPASPAGRRATRRGTAA